MTAATSQTKRPTGTAKSPARSTTTARTTTGRATTARAATTKAKAADSPTSSRTRSSAAKSKASATRTTTNRRARTARAEVDNRFDEWFEAPVFEPGPDERLEELATSSRGPMRLAASAVLRVDAATSGLRRRRDEEVIDLRDDEPVGMVGAPTGLRRRISQWLDGWADREVAAQDRLEKVLLPVRWRG